MAAGSGSRQCCTGGTAVLPFHLTLNLLPAMRVRLGLAWSGLVIMGHGHGQGVGVYYANISALTRAGK